MYTLDTETKAALIEDYKRAMIDDLTRRAAEGRLSDSGHAEVRKLKGGA